MAGIDVLELDSGAGVGAAAFLGQRDGSRSDYPRLSLDPHRGVTRVSLLHGPFDPLGANFQPGLIDEQPAVGGAEDNIGFAVAVEVGDGGGDGALRMAGGHVDGAGFSIAGNLEP